MTFNGIRKDYLTVLEVGTPYSAPVKRNILSVPGVPGGYLKDTDIEPIVIPVKVLIEAESADELKLVVEDLSAWLYTKEPVALTFDREPNRTYYAVRDGEIDKDEIVMFSTVTISFLCPDPFKHGPEKVETGTSELVIQNEGTAPTYPIVEIEVKEPTTFLAIGDGENVNMVGDYQQAGNIPYIPLERKFWSEANSMIGWTDSTTATDATVSGQMKTDGESFYTNDYGVGPSYWHGPAIKTSLPESLQDFRIDALVTLRQYNPSNVGRIVVVGLDELDNVVARAQLWKRSKYLNQNEGLFAVGNGMTSQTVRKMHAAKDWMWSNFKGVIRIERVGNEWLCYVSTIDYATGIHTYPLGYIFRDDEHIYTNPIRQIRVELSTFSDWSACHQRIDDVKVYKVNRKPEELDYIAVEGDKVIFDHVGNAIYRNGELIKKRKAFIGKYFDLKPGVNTLLGEPAEAIKNMGARWNPKWR